MQVGFGISPQPNTSKENRYSKVRRHPSICKFHQKSHSDAPYKLEIKSIDCEVLSLFREVLPSTAVD
ncbi:MAG: hypothetical protein QQW96_21975 [Tychonema bourrellyi B0820]|uniref:hypothetical protein n=1 Tax=Tychonema bourrellyi TaxID=54313 RepID=UPI001180AECC|nr:hypothetical protein [Tychonema bourrellyi]MDQ2100304.1 hypothetical protein [Tychonema bourrellyi B0820]